jgi:RNA polymerase sigma factor (sigma-70 family)
VSTAATINPEEHLGLVCMIVSKYVPRGVPIEDTEEYADGVLALLTAVEKYNPEKHKTEFSTFAVKCIKTALIQKWRKQRRKKRDGNVTSLGDRSVMAPVDCGNYEFLMSLFEDHPDDTPEDRRNKKVLFDHFINEMTWQDIGDQMVTRYGQERPVTKAGVRYYAQAAIDLIRERFGIEEFVRLEEIFS